MDPFRAVQEDVTNTFADIENELAKWRKLPSKSPKVEPGRQRILSSLSELQVDLQDMQATIDIALKDPAKFALTPSELMTRQTFVREMQAQANDARDLLDPTPAASGRLAAKAAMTRVDRNELLSGCSSSSADGASVTSGTRAVRDQAAWADNEASLQQQQQQHESIVASQEQELGVLGGALERLGVMGKTMNEELKAQGKELDALGSDVDETSNKMHQATAVMKKMLKQKDRGKFCAILVLSLVLILLLYAVVAW